MSDDLRLAFVGKGGAGKSMVSGTVCRMLARSGRRVLALDVDTLPGLAISIGLSGHDARLPAGLAERIEGKGWQPVKSKFRPARLVEQYAAHAPDGVRFLELGKLPGRLEQSRVIAFRGIMERFRGEGWTVVADLAAGTRQPHSGWAGFARTVIVVADPSAKSLLSGRRLLSIATHVVANKIRSPQEVEIVTNALPLPLIGVIPYDESLAESERRGLAPIDVVPDAPAVEAVGELVERLTRRDT
ncbi:MAG: hypothetical protein ABR564_08520 [Candidatus Dormibacteria bacterium]